MIASKVKAGALQLTMFIVVVIALLLATFILFIHTHKTFDSQTDFVIETVENTNKGIQYALNNTLPENDTIPINLEDEDFKTLKVQRDFWGVFEKVTSIARIKNKTIKKMALVGASQPEMDRLVLYVEDHNRPLVLVGNTKIEGVAYVPKQGVRTGNIAGHSYYGEALIYGATKSSNTLPKLKPEILLQIEHIINKIKSIDQNQFLDLSKSHQNSFLNPLQVVYSSTDILLSEISLTGNIMVQSDTKVIVNESSNLKDIILIAPKIEIQSDVKGVFQCFASKEISIGKNCNLNYPSALVLTEGTRQVDSVGNNNETPFIKVIKGAKIKGVIAYLGTSKNYKPQVFLDENTTITGEVYCNQNLELLGTVQGSVFTSNFVASQSGSIYQNHIYNGKIIVNDLPLEYIGLQLEVEDSNKGIAKWLY